MMVQYGPDLAAALTGLATTPTLAWCSLVPQLRSHLGHPSAWVRAQLSSLLNRVGKDYPSVLVYPTVVGMMRGRISRVFLLLLLLLLLLLSVFTMSYVVFVFV
jgi:hypothetical protein